MEPRRRSRAVWISAAALALLVLARLALTPIAAWRTREALANLEGYRAAFSYVSVSVLHLSYAVHGLRLIPSPRSTRPAFRAEYIDLAIDVPELLRRHGIVLRAVLDHPRLDVVIREGAGGTKASDADVRSDLARLSPFHVDRLDVKSAEVAFTDEAAPARPALRLRDFDVAVENLPSRLPATKGEPTTLAASGTLQRSGQVSIFVTADPFARRLSFAGRAAVEGLAVREIADLLARKTDFFPTRGTIDVFATFRAVEGHLTGYVKPITRDVELKAAPGKPALKAWLADATLKLLGESEPGRATSAGVPIHGDLTSPKAELWAAVWAVLRNSFVLGVESGLAQPRATNSAGPVPQARQPRRGAGR
jgi:hypothetical protein